MEKLKAKMTEAIERERRHNAITSEKEKFIEELKSEKVKATKKVNMQEQDIAVLQNMIK